MSWWVWVLIGVAVLAILFAVLLYRAVASIGESLAKATANGIGDYVNHMLWNR